MRLLAIAAALLVIPGASAAWTSFHADGLNTGSVNAPDYQPYVDVWWNVKLDGDPDSENADEVANAPAPITASPVVKDGILVIGDWAGRVRALDAEGGDEVWRYDMPSKVTATAAMDGNKVFAVDEAGNLMAFDLQTGTELITSPVAIGATLASPAIHEGKLYIGNEAGEMKAYDTSTLTEDWSFVITSVQETSSTNPDTGKVTCSDPHPAGPIRGTPVVYEDQVMFGALNDYFYSLDANGNPDGSTDIQWFFQSNDDIVASPTVNDNEGEVIFASYDGMVYSIDATQGTPNNECYGKKVTSTAWRLEVSGNSATRIQSSPATDGTNVYFGTPDDNMYAIDARTGKLVWAASTGDDINSSPAVANGYVVVGSNDDQVYWFSAETGEVVKKFRTANSVEASPAIENNRAFVASFDGSIYMLGPEVLSRPDLIVASATADNSSISVTIRNQDAGDAGENVLRIEMDGALVAFVDVPAIEAGGSHTATFARAISDEVHTISAIVDFNETVIESNEGNNVYETSVDLSPEGAAGKKAEKEGIPAPAMIWLLAGIAILARRRR